MTLRGYMPLPAASKGGLRSIELMRAGDIAEVATGSRPGTFASIRLRPGESAARYRFKEDEASLEESVDTAAGLHKVSHRLVFTLRNSGEGFIPALDDIARNSREGIVALVVENSGRKRLVGYSVHYARQRPMRLAKVVSVSGGALGDCPAATVTLESSDVDLAAEITGGIIV